jgi:HD-GYP domain-containing protein (c-di-GMP phosphodiesterase class II)
VSSAGDAPSGVRLAELVASLSLATDLGLGQPQGHVLRQTVIAARLAAAAGLSDDQQASVYYASLLAWVGCVSDSHELAKWFGDDLRLRDEAYRVDKAGLPLMWFMVGHVGAGAPPLRRLTMVGRFLAGGSREVADAMLSHCQSAALIAEELGLGEVGDVLAQSFERWDGRGVPGHRSGASIDPVMRVVQVADDAEVLARSGGVDAAVAELRARRGTEFDPDLVDLVCERAGEILGDVDEEAAWSGVIAAVAPLDRELTEARLSGALLAVADLADLKSPTWSGHSRAVALLASDAARRLGLSSADQALVQRAGLVHDLGAVGISTGIWDKPGPLSDSERERVRTHPYLTERMLTRPSALRTIGTCAALHHERLDGSGYPRGIGGETLPITARVLAAADVAHALAEDRPHRARLGETERTAVLRAEVRVGRLDGEAVNAVLGAAGQRVRRRAELPAGLTGREVEVLQLLVVGRSNKQIANALGVTARTAGSHIEHIYAKIGVSSRGAAAYYAMHNGLMTDPSGG